MNDSKICWKLLPKVSRSFSLCIELLPKNVDDGMMLAYLIYRLIDTIEDSTIKSTVKKSLMKDFIGILDNQTYDQKSIEIHKSNLLNKLTYTYEEDLLKNLDAVVRFYFSRSKKERDAILKQGKEMARGMLKFQSKNILTFKDQDEYCYYVAGVVGYLINDLFYINGILTKKKNSSLMQHSKRYGLGLQKVNIIRDIAYDIPDKRFYWPQDTLKKHGLTYDNICQEKNRKKSLLVLDDMIKNALPFLNDGLYYTMSLPRTALKARVFCLIPLFMAIQSFVKCVGNENVFIKGKKVKISRSAVKSIVRKSYLYGSSNTLLKAWYNKCMKKAGIRFKEP